MKTKEDQAASWRKLPRNIWATSITSFLTDISTEMVVNLLPLYLFNVLGVNTAVIGLIEGLAEATASLLKLFSGWISDRLGGRKWVAVIGYGISAFSKPFYLVAASWQAIAAVRWADRVGKGIRTSPRDALIADSVSEEQRGLAFGVNRAADTGGALLGLLITLFVVLSVQGGTEGLSASTFKTLVLISLIPAVIGVVVLAVMSKDVPVEGKRALPKFALRGLGRPFLIFMVIIAIFDLGNSADAFLILRAQERGLSIAGILGMLIIFNLVYSLLATPAGSLSDRVGRRRVLIGGWLLYAAVYMGFALAASAWNVWLLYGLYGAYYGLTYGTAKAFVADLVPVSLRGTAYGTYNASLGLIDLPASLIAGLLWQNVSESAPFFFGAILALVAALALLLWRPKTKVGQESRATESA
jgi:MFS family permease